RCIRFDLKRIETGVMVRHLEKICAAEGVAAEPDALALIARVAEGSVRDALSLLDQGIAHAATGRVAAADVRAMLGLSDRGDVIELFVHAMSGAVAPALELMDRLHLAGADPAALLIELAEFCHLVTRAKLAPNGIDEAAISETERRRSAELAKRLNLGPLTRAWQILLKGVEDVKDSPRPLASAEMALIRLAHAADLPSPEDALRRLAEAGDGAPRVAPPPSSPARPTPSGGAASALRVSAPVASPAPSGAPRLSRFEDVVALARAKRDIRLCQALEADVRLARFEQGRIEFSLIAGASPAVAQDLSRRLQEWTGERWMVSVASGASAPTLREKDDARRAERLTNIGEHPVVRRVLELFPGARISAVRSPEPEPPPAPPPPTDEDVGYADAHLDMLDEDDL
ncbi:MAG: DNA polymerase III subunit gamma/tau, partial [Hyphomicrobiales bacterium]|nr:DNA polymerase III subunit gamma/tau [Hyphomicrobiales bacterium]